MQNVIRSLDVLLCDIQGVVTSVDKGILFVSIKVIAVSLIKSHQRIEAYKVTQASKKILILHLRFQSPDIGYKIFKVHTHIKRFAGD